MTQELMTVQAGEVGTAEKSFDDFVEEWQNFLAKKSAKHKREAKPRTLESYRYALKVFKSWLDGEGIAIGEANEQTISDWTVAMNAAKNSKGQPWSPSTKNLYLSGVRSFFKWLAAEYKNLGVVDITAGFGNWECSREHKRGFLSLEDMGKLLAVVPSVTEEKIAEAEKKFKAQQIKAEKRGSTFNYAARLKSYAKTARLQGLRDKAILATLMCGALRTIEISRLTIGDIAHNGGACVLYVMGKGRTEKETVKISRKAERVIREWLTAREAVDVVSNDSPLFCSVANNSFGEAITSLSVSRLCKEYLRAAELKNKVYQSEDKATSQTQQETKPVTAHSLRGSAATCAVNSGAPLLAVKQHLRHCNISTTMIYVEEAEKFKNPVSDIIADSLFGGAA